MLRKGIDSESQVQVELTLRGSEKIQQGWLEGGGLCLNLGGWD